MEKVVVFLIFDDFCIVFFEETFIWYLICFEKLFLEYMIGSCGWCMRYYMPCMRAMKSGSAGSLVYPLRRMVGY